MIQPACAATGAVQLAGTGVALSIFNTVTKLFNVPLLSVTTSTVAAAKGRAQASSSTDSSAMSAAISSALVIAAVVGIFEVSTSLIVINHWTADADCGVLNIAVVVCARIQHSLQVEPHCSRFILWQLHGLCDPNAFTTCSGLSVVNVMYVLVVLLCCCNISPSQLNCMPIHKHKQPVTAFCVLTHVCRFCHFYNAKQLSLTLLYL